MTDYYKIRCYTCNDHLLLHEGHNKCGMCKDQYIVNDIGLWQVISGDTKKLIKTGSQLLGVKL